MILDVKDTTVKSSDGSFKKLGDHAGEVLLIVVKIETLYFFSLNILSSS